MSMFSPKVVVESSHQDVSAAGKPAAAEKPARRPPPTADLQP